ncbi:hypothetical protein [Streptomyces varsoviensis]|uniref:WXG100 family type VII secretion target n=1 Tax=Streptomyces varsoviensis TaxID=67373 RepID=A0ABR5J658_9ACTN|nr:hypothetical protein [Streptomyces varsoviensis]KOG88951.1 hypothetical protein ADK38_16920 [Streptomyces varsoviensis]
MGEPHLDSNQAGLLSKDDSAMQQTLNALKEHLNEMANAGTTVQGIKQEVAQVYQARSSQSHCAAIDDWLAIHARITQATENFHEGTHLTNLAMNDAEDESDSYAANLMAKLGGGGR